jgi:hypothetical protein
LLRRESNLSWTRVTSRQSCGLLNLAAITLLYVAHRRRRHTPARRTAAEHGDYAAVAQALERRDVRRVEERLRLFERQPVAGRHFTKLYEGWIVATPDRRRFAVRITSYPALDISIPFEWSATAAEVTQRVRAAMDD